MILKYFSVVLTCLFAQIFSQQSSVVTVAIVDFEKAGMSELEIQTLEQRFTAELLNTAKAILVDKEVLNAQIVSAGYEIPTCKDVECVLMAIGDTLGVQYIITGSIKKNKEKYALETVFTDVTTGLEERTIKTSYKGPVDGMVVELEIMAWDIMNLEAPEQLAVKRKGKAKKKIRRPGVKTSLGALARASVIPGWGHYYLDQNARGLAFYSSEIIALSLGYIAYRDYDRAYGKVETYWGQYKTETNEQLLQYYKGKTLTAEEEMVQKNNTLITMFRAAAIIHACNMIDSYMLDRY